MITAIDTNVLIDVFGADPAFGEKSAAAVRRCLHDGALVACAVVWAQTAVAFPSREKFARAMNDLSVAFDPMTGETALKAAEAWRRYRAHGGMRTRIASDFLIGAHAQGRADRLLTRDRGFFRRYFAGLKVLDPSRP
ncbi:MAG TPA: type II toxin-antitoxin system VapC family toxin [Candidatus Binataceae bacterium]|nr:type II toxin-antitoxin system VapC family toxin [Candidatus Binataceae bacterium]